MQVVLIPGDGIGKEISKSVMKVSDALHTGIEWIEQKAGAEYYETSKKLMEDGLVNKLWETKVALKGPTATPVGTGFRSINVQLRQTFQTYANLRPVKSILGVNGRFSNIDLVVIRENTEDLYKGIEYKIDEDTVNGVKLITRAACDRIIRFSFEYARRNHRKKVTCVHKANIMKLTDGLFLEVFQNIAKDYPEIKSENVIIDACCMKLVTNPSDFDVIVTENLYGDILSDLCAGLVGGLGFAPSANIGDEVIIYEAVHGSAPDIAGKNKANPTAISMAFEMLLRDHNMDQKAKCLQKAIEEVILEGKYTTEDIGGSGTTESFTGAILERL